MVIEVVELWWTNDTRDEFIRKVWDDRDNKFRWFRYATLSNALVPTGDLEPENIHEFNQIFDIKDYFTQYDPDGTAFLIVEALKGYAYWSKGRVIQEDLEELLK